MCFESNSTNNASNAICTYLKQIGALPISQNSLGVKSAYVPTKDTRDAYEKIIHFNMKKKMLCQQVTGQTSSRDRSPPDRQPKYITSSIHASY